MKKIGILTPHSQLNFGGVLQAFAMLEGAKDVSGMDTLFLDWWRDERNSDLERGVADWGWKRWAKVCIRAVLGGGEGSFLLRQWRTKRWMKKCFRKTEYHFCRWGDVENLGVDIVSVGSDQVWYYDKTRLPDPFMLDGAPHVPAIAYAASFGMLSLPVAAKEIYERGFKRFRAIGVREKSAVAMIEECGVRATHVADPTLMVGLEFWRRRFKVKDGRNLVYYKIASSVVDDLAILEDFARRNRCKVDVFVDSLVNQLYFPISWRHPFRWVMMIYKRLFSPVRLHLGAGPMQFVSAIAQARWVMSDSFHGLMFSAIFNKNIRQIKPTLDFRVKMFSRISDFASEFIKGDVFSSSIKQALDSFESGETIEYRYDLLNRFVCVSRQWYADAVRECVKGR